MKSLNPAQLPDGALIIAHLQAAESDAAKSSLGSTEAGRAMLEADADRKASLAARGIELWFENPSRDTSRVASALLRSEQKDWSAARLTPLVAAAAALERSHPLFTWFNVFPHKPLITAVEKAVDREGLPSGLRAALERWKEALSPRALTPKEERELGEAERDSLQDPTATPWSEISDAFATIERLERIRRPLKDESQLLNRLSRLLSVGEKPQGRNEPPLVAIDATDAVSCKIALDLAEGGRATGRSWAELLQYSRTLTAAKPSANWLKLAVQRVAAIESTSFAACVADWFNEAGKAAPQKTVFYRQVADATLLNECSAELLKGLAWAAAAAGRVDVAPALGNLAEACFKKLPNIGPRNVKVGNAAVAVLAALGKPEAAAQLWRLRLSVKHPSSRATIDKALSALSRSTGISPDDLAEISVPAFGLDADGKRRVLLGDCSCSMQIISSRKVELRWNAGDGKESDAAPAAVRKQFGGELKRLQREAKDASIMLAAQVLRLERSYLNDRTWPFDAWEKRFLNHPLIGTLARRLIWQFEDGPAVPREGGFVDAKDQSVRPKQGTMVSLWHPIRSNPSEVLAWRKWLEQHHVTQPFKQAHREIYLLTDAERQTGSYSNRFAAHLIRQHQFAALAKERGWTYQLQGTFDSHNTATLLLPRSDLTAEFWVEPGGGNEDTSGAGIYLHLATDQVRFLDSTGTPRALSEVPALVFSEIMRDVDLFVGVCSVGNDPAWMDGGHAGAQGDYWRGFAFGDLSATAKTRRDVLERLLLRLKIAGRCALQDRFLVVRGSLRTYKIHLGSGNILMEPNDQYLCIVPDRSPAAQSQSRQVFLPFEGDNTLAVILSKAFLLADDAKIKDQTILRQIQVHGDTIR